jgi:hypothetical protein
VSDWKLRYILKGDSRTYIPQRILPSRPDQDPGWDPIRDRLNPNPTVAPVTPAIPAKRNRINAHVLRRIPIEDTATSNPDHLRQVPFADHLNIIAAMIGELHTPMEF